MTLKVYADNDVVSTLRRWDAPPLENAAIRQLATLISREQATKIPMTRSGGPNVSLPCYGHHERRVGLGARGRHRAITPA